MEEPSSRILMAVFFSLILTLYPMESTPAFIEIAYDDGRPETTSSLNIGEHLAVRFSLPPGLSKAKLLKARIYKAGRSETDVIVHILGSNGITELTAPFTFRLTVESAWNDVDLTGCSIVVLGDFYISIEYLKYYDPLIGRDTTNPRGRSYYGRPSSWTIVNNGENVMIRAVVDGAAPLTMMTGEGSWPLNVLIAFAPYLLLVGVIALVFKIMVASGRLGFRRKTREQECTSST